MFLAAMPIIEPPQEVPSAEICTPTSSCSEEEFEGPAFFPAYEEEDQGEGEGRGASPKISVFFPAYDEESQGGGARNNAVFCPAYEEEQEDGDSHDGDDERSDIDEYENDDENAPDAAGLHYPPCPSAAAPSPPDLPNQDELLLQSTATKVVGGYALMHTIGAGCTAVVKVAVNLKTGSKHTVKIIPRSSVTEADLQREVQAWMHLGGHPFIMPLRQVLHSAKNYYLVSDFAQGGTLEELRKQKANGRFPESEVRTVIWQLASALAYCHEHGTAHRDIKPSNVLFDQGCVKLCDFGLASPCDLLLAAHGSHGAAGTPMFAAPDVLDGRCRNGAAADSWSLGVLMYQLLTGTLPFNLKSSQGSVSKLFDSIHEESSFVALPHFVSLEASSIIAGLLKVDPQLRLTMADLLENEWFSSCKQAGKWPLPLLAA